MKVIFFRFEIDASYPLSKNNSPNNNLIFSSLIVDFNSFFSNFPPKFQTAKFPRIFNDSPYNLERANHVAGKNPRLGKEFDTVYKSETGLRFIGRNVCLKDESKCLNDRKDRWLKRCDNNKFVEEITITLFWGIFNNELD